LRKLKNDLSILFVSKLNVKFKNLSPSTQAFSYRRGANFLLYL